mmetsp:Transcript_118090/g.220764  ORF Transcript_118090/g.220764 Transcript_118090/m.220764 type:complete len:202 (-) Transcript_118090:1070-1675(-)
MAVLCSRQDLLHHVRALALFHWILQPHVMIHDPAIQIATLTQLHDKVDVATSVLLRVSLEVNLVQFHNVRVIQRFHERDFCLNQSPLAGVMRSDRLASPQRFGAPVFHDHHLAKCPNSYISAELVVVENSKASNIGWIHDVCIDLRGTHSTFCRYVSLMTHTRLVLDNLQGLVVVASRQELRPASRSTGRSETSRARYALG